jgi:hypothetical protein
VGIRCAYHATLYPQKLELTSQTSGGRSVGIVRSWAEATEFVCCSAFERPSSHSHGLWAGNWTRATTSCTAHRGTQFTLHGRQLVQQLALAQSLHTTSQELVRYNMQIVSLCLISYSGRHEWRYSATNLHLDTR